MTTLTKNVTALAHDAKQAAADLGGHALEVGRSAGATGIDAATSMASTVASNVASKASQLAETIAAKTPTVTVKRRSKHRSKLKILVLLALVGAGAFAAMKRRGSAPAAPAGDDRANGDATGGAQVKLAS